MKFNVSCIFVQSSTFRRQSCCSQSHPTNSTRDFYVMHNETLGLSVCLLPHRKVAYAAPVFLFILFCLIPYCFQSSNDHAQYLPPVFPSISCKTSSHSASVDPSVVNCSRQQPGLPLSMKQQLSLRTRWSSS